jgi:hypothetical protein
MAATKVMKFWAVCLAVLGKLLASLGVSAAATAARREAALYEAAAHTATPATVTGAAPGAAWGRGPKAVNSAARAGEPLPLYGPAGPGLRMSASPQLPPTIKQRIRAEAHGSSPTSRSRLATGTEPLHTAPAEAALRSEAGADEIPAAIPAARRREQNAAYAA